MAGIICGSEPDKPIATGLKHCPRCGDVLTHFGYFRAMLREGSVIRGHNFYPDRPGACPLCGCEDPSEYTPVQRRSAMTDIE